MDMKYRIEVLNKFHVKMKRSGYSQRQVAEIMTAGLLGHTRKMRQRHKRHRRGHETEGERRMKRLTGKTSWYKKRQNKKERQETTGTKGEG